MCPGASLETVGEMSRNASIFGQRPRSSSRQLFHRLVLPRFKVNRECKMLFSLILYYRKWLREPRRVVYINPTLQIHMVLIACPFHAGNSANFLETAVRHPAPDSSFSSSPGHSAYSTVTEAWIMRLAREAESHGMEEGSEAWTKAAGTKKQK